MATSARIEQSTNRFQILRDRLQFLATRVLPQLPPVPAPPKQAAETKEPREHKPTMEDPEIFALDNATFVREAYERVLGRWPDDRGREMVEALDKGETTKDAVLARLRYSSEGRQRRARVDGVGPVSLLHVLEDRPGWKQHFTALRRFFTLHLKGHEERIGALEDDLAAFREDQTSAVLAVEQRMTQALTQQSAALRSQLEQLNDRIAALADVVRHLVELAELNDRREEAAMDTVEPATASLQLIEGQMKQLKRELVAMRDRPVARATPGNGRGMELERPAPSTDALYLAFEDAFRGTQREIRTRVSAYLGDVRATMKRTGGGRVVDLGCGRGEWLEVLAEEKISCTGVDSNIVLVTECRERGLDVVESDAISYLRGQPESSISALSTLHVIEHLPFQLQLELLRECFRVLRPGGLLIVETPNPENLIIGGCNFYMDPTHIRPLPPTALEFYTRYSGFESVEVRRLHEHRLASLPPPDDDGEIGARDRQLLIAAERALFAAPDYAILARKPGI